MRFSGGARSAIKEPVYSRIMLSRRGDSTSARSGLGVMGLLGKLRGRAAEAQCSVLAVQTYSLLPTISATIAYERRRAG